MKTKIRITNTLLKRLGQLEVGILVTMVATAVYLVTFAGQPLAGQPQPELFQIETRQEETVRLLQEIRLDNERRLTRLETQIIELASMSQKFEKAFWWMFSAVGLWAIQQIAHLFTLNRNFHKRNSKPEP